MNKTLVKYNNRNVNIELIRIVGCVLVVARHVFTAIDFEAPGVLKGLIYTFTINGVALFWLIMGFYLFSSKYNFIKKLRTTIIKIIIPSGVLTFISILIFPWILGEMSFPQSVSRQIGWQKFIQLMIYDSGEMKIADHLWYVKAYVKVILWSPLLLYICREGKKEQMVRRYLIVFEFLSILFENIQYLLHQERVISSILYIETPIDDVILYVLLGYELSGWLKTEKSGQVAKWKVFVGYIFSVLCVAGLEFICKIRNLEREYYNHSETSFFIVATVFLFVFLYKISIKDKYKKVILYLGDKTFYIYLIHYCITRKLTTSAINKMEISKNLGLLKYFVCILITFILSLIIADVIKRLECSMFRRKKLQLPNVTLIAVTSVKVEETVKALLYSMRGIDFGECVLVSHEKPADLPKEITFKYIPQLTCIDHFNKAMVYDMGKYVDTDYMLLVHYDGFVVNPKSWRDEFLDYDYVGSPWPLPKDDIHYRDSEGNICRVGNSVSLRSKKLLELPSQMQIPWELVDENDEYNEDTFLCCKHKNELEKQGIRYAPIEVAKYFGHERMIPEIKGIKPFVFHKWAGTNIWYPMFHRTFWEKTKIRIMSYVRH